jgi:uncharacterized protein YqcC (DUF446 family)
MAKVTAAQVRPLLDGVVDALKAQGVWDIERPQEAAFEHMGAFGTHTMAFEQWLRWVFVPSVEKLLSSDGPWPPSSSVSVQATREGDTDSVAAALVAPLAAFDALFNAPG